MVRFTIVTASMSLPDTQLLVLIRPKLIRSLRDDTKHLASCKSFKTFIEGVKSVDLLQQQEEPQTNINPYGGSYPLTKEEKAQLDASGRYYKCHQPGHRAGDRLAPCKDQPWCWRTLSID